MGNVLTVAVRHPSANLESQVSSLLFRQSSLARRLHNVLEHVATVDELEDEVDGVVVLEDLDELTDVVLGAERRTKLSDART